MILWICWGNQLHHGKVQLLPSLKILNIIRMKLVKHLSKISRSKTQIRINTSLEDNKRENNIIKAKYSMPKRIHWTLLWIRAATKRCMHLRWNLEELKLPCKVHIQLKFDSFIVPTTEQSALAMPRWTGWNLMTLSQRMLKEELQIQLVQIIFVNLTIYLIIWIQIGQRDRMFQNFLIRSNTSKILKSASRVFQLEA